MKAPNETLALGERIVRELGISSHGNTFSRWLCHYLAELIVAERSTANDDRKEIQTTIVETISKIWTRRNDFQRDIHSLEHLHQVLGTIRFQQEGIAKQLSRKQ